MAGRFDSRLTLLQAVPRGSVPAGRVVVLAARIMASCAIPRGSLVVPAVDESVRVRASAANPAPDAASGGLVRAGTHDQSNVLELACWNIGEPQSLNFTGNRTHAERQMVEYLKAMEAAAPGFFGSIVSIEIDINRSPCTACADSLCGLLNRIRAARPAVAAPVRMMGGRKVFSSPSAAPVPATLRWQALHAGGPQATNWAALLELSRAGWRLLSPADARPGPGSVHQGLVTVGNL